ncbi:hypothetical protein CALCODRAFT_104628 [Calocera cornea HHB12733]|uniref:F-box domain-containing protein n=1 Tax=Calocera cornea HHB12733 TaxID=1353952 RepID=A0A165D446_9BASI|nr:hypothetical protein CALCODRAFT_104628 [Calocera cornea HHB12733]
MPNGMPSATWKCNSERYLNRFSQLRPFSSSPFSTVTSMLRKLVSALKPRTSSNTLTDHTSQDRSSGIRKLDADVLLHIFGFCRDIDPVSVWAISRTSRQWRQLALQHSTLWTHIVIDRSSVRLLGGFHLLRWLQEWILRSGMVHVLDFKLDFMDAVRSKRGWAPTWTEIEDILCTTGTRAHRWRSFTYTLDAAKIRPGPSDYWKWSLLSSFIRAVSRLQTLHLSSGCKVPAERRLTPQVFYGMLNSISPSSTGWSASLFNISLEPEQTWRGRVEQLCYNVAPMSSFGPHHLCAALASYPHTRTMQLRGWSVARNAWTSWAVLYELEELTIEPNWFMTDVVSSVHILSTCHTSLDSYSMQDTIANTIEFQHTSFPGEPKSTLQSSSCSLPSDRPLLS